MDKPSPLKRPRRYGLIALLGVILALLIAGSLAAFLAYRRSHPRDAFGYYTAGVNCLNEKDFPRAFRLLSEAARLGQTNALYLDAASRAASMVGQKDEALRYAQLAWESGNRTAEQLRLILGGLDRRDVTNQLPLALRLVALLPTGSESAELRGDVYYYFGKTDEALKTWLDLLARAGNSRLAVKAAEAFLVTKQKEKAISLLEGELAQDRLDENGYAALATIYSFDDVLYTNALRVFDEARQRGRYSEDFKLAHALTCLINQKAGEALPLLESLKQPAADPASSGLRVNARLFLGTLFLNQKNRNGIEELEALNRQTPSGPIKEAEALFYRGLLALLDQKDGALDSLRNAHRLASEHAAIALVFATASSQAGQYSDAIAACEGVRGPLTKWPALMLERASALQKNGKPSETLRVLSQLHTRKLFSKRSLSLFRDAAYASNAVRDGQRTQSFLEEKFPNDPDVKFFSGYAALRQRDFEKAAGIFRELNEEFPQEARYQLAEAQVLMARGEARAALEILKKVQGKPELIAPLVGIAHARLQEWKEAREAFEQALKSPQRASVLVEYGMVLLQLNLPVKAAGQFEQAFAKDPNQIDARLGLALAAYSRGGEQLEVARRHAALLVNNRELDVSRLLFLASSELRYAAYTNALEYCRLAVAKDKNSVEARALRGTILGLLGRFPEAEEDLLWAASQKPDTLSIQRDLANLYLRSEDYAKASNRLEQLLVARPKDREILLMKFDLLGRAGQLDAAAEFLAGLKTALAPAQFALCSSWLAQLKGDDAEASAQLAPYLTNAIVAFQWGRLQLDSGEADSSVVQKLRGARLDAAQWAALASLAERRRLTNMAVLCYEEALALNPDDPALLNNWAWSSIQLPRFDEKKVVAACRRAHAEMPRNPDVLDTYADVLMRCRRYQECVNLLERNLTVVNQTPQLLWAQASAYEMTNEKKKALEAYTLCQGLLKATNASIRFNPAEVRERIAQLRPAPR